MWVWPKAPGDGRLYVPLKSLIGGWRDCVGSLLLSLL